LVIIGIIAAIAIPAIGSTIKNAENKSVQASKDMIKEATLRYLLDNQVTPFTGEGNTITYTSGTAVTSPADVVTTLKNTGYLAEIPTNVTTSSLVITITNNANGGWTVTVT